MNAVSLLIDGYNLLHATGLAGLRRAGLQSSREALLQFLAEALTPRERERTTIVFDASEAPLGLPRETRFAEIRVLYAADYPDADALLEELIQAEHAPRRLLVVSSDHRVQRAATRRRARCADSDVWFSHAVRRRRPRRPSAGADDKPTGPLTGGEVEHWLRAFGASTAESPPSAESSPRSESSDHGASPFPPGYGEDLLE